MPTHRPPAQSYLDVLRMAGTAAPTVEAWAERLLTSGAVPSVQLAVHRHGEPVVSVAGGWHARERRHADRGSLYLLYSSTKLFTVLLMGMLRERGCFDWDDPVAATWPEFAQKGKDGVTIRHVITHRVGIAAEPAGTAWPQWRHRDWRARFVERSPLKWVPGEKGGYHNRTWGFMLEELMQRWTGRTFTQLLHEDVLDPLGIDDWYYGPPPAALDRFLTTELNQGTPFRLPPKARDEFRPFIDDEANMWNAPSVVATPMSAATATTTAENASALAGFLAGKGLHRAVRLFSEDVFAELTARQSPEGEVDATLGYRAVWGLGLQIELFADVPGLAGAVGHGGGASVHVWGHPQSGLSAACILGGIRDQEAAKEAFGGLGPLAWHRAFAQAVATDLA